MAGAIDLERTGGAGDVARGTLRVSRLYGELVTLHAEDVVQREAAGHREALLVAGMAVDLGARQGGAVVAAARVMQRCRDLRIAPSLVDTQSADNVREGKALVVKRRGAESQLGHRHVRAHMAAAAAIGRAGRRGPAVPEQQARPAPV